jgi:Flp pilus assembly protein TadG
MLIAIRSKLIRKTQIAKRLHKNEDGAAAVEFALVALPFFGMIFAIIELGIFFFASRFLEDGVFNAGRKALTQNLTVGSSCTDFVNSIKANVGGWFDTSKLVVNVSVLSNFSATSPALDLSSAGCSMGASNSTILIRVSYPYPFTGFRFLSTGPVIGANLNLNAATALRVE